MDFEDSDEDIDTRCLFDGAGCMTSVASSAISDL